MSNRHIFDGQRDGGALTSVLTKGHSVILEPENKTIQRVGAMQNRPNKVQVLGGHTRLFSTYECVCDYLYDQRL